MTPYKISALADRKQGIALFTYINPPLSKESPGFLGFFHFLLTVRYSKAPFLMTANLKENRFALCFYLFIYHPASIGAPESPLGTK